MGKRHRGSDQTHNSSDPPSSSDNIPCSSQTEVLSKEKPSQLVDSSDLKPFPSGTEITDNSVKLFNAHHHYNLGRSVFLKRSSHHYCHQYSRRNSGNHGNASSSHGKGPPLHEERLSFKLASHCNTRPGSHSGNMIFFDKKFCCQLPLQRIRIYVCILWMVSTCFLCSNIPLGVGILSAYRYYY